MDANGIQRIGCMVASPYPNARHVLLVMCDVTPPIGQEPEILMFVGGFDPPNVVRDVNREAGFIAFMYPAPEANELMARLGTIDYLAT
jgi:hypothetical protein